MANEAKQTKGVISFCGAFNGSVSRRNGETDEQAAQRVQDAMQRVMDRYAKRLHVSIGVDFGDIGHEERAALASARGE